MPRSPLRHAAFLAVFVLPGGAEAAGGHHAVDDAAIADPGQCQVETWFDRELGGARALAHVGPGCRVGPVELGLNLDRTRAAADGMATSAGVQLKWATALSETLAVGIVVGSARQESAQTGPIHGILIPFTWRPDPALQWHVNVGRDLRRDGGTSHGGVAVEWAAVPRWSFVGERFREQGANRWRLGARWSMTPALDVDLSRAGAPAALTLGLAWTFER
jgi:hypothetical protein